MQAIKFDEKTHTYTDKKGKVPSVTKVLPDIPEWLMHKQHFILATLRGTRVHEHAEQLNNHFKRYGVIEPDILSFSNGGDCMYVKAYIAFMHDEIKKIIAVEQRVYHPLLGYAGTLDIVVDTFSWGIILCDIKCVVSLSPATGLQTAAYCKAYNYRNKQKVFKRAALQLKANGTYRVKLYKVKDIKYDFDIFLCKLRSYQWDRDNKMGAFQS